jgi:hypothetical protein
MLEYLFISYGSITAVDLEHIFENLYNTWDPRQLVETLFKEIQDCVYYVEAEEITISEAQNLTTGYNKVFSTGNFHSVCRSWYGINPQDKTWNNFKVHFATAYRQHKKMQMQGEPAATSGYANDDVAQPEYDDLSETSIDAFYNLATAIVVDCDIVDTLTCAIFALQNN